MSHYVPEEALDQKEIERRGGSNLGDEDFALFKCPHCHSIYLMDYEVDTVYLDPHDLNQRVSAFDGFTCAACNEPVPEGRWVGPHVEDRFRVTWGELLSSHWSWVVADVSDSTRP
jgi:hypothetical protein